MTQLLSEGFVDTYRRMYPDKTGAYTFWTYMLNSRAKNTGWYVSFHNQLFLAKVSFLSRRYSFFTVPSGDKATVLIKAIAIHHVPPHRLLPSLVH